jgi:hypothetical protein
METAKQLEEMIESDEVYCDSNFAYLMFDLDGGSTPKASEAIDGEWFGLPSWIDHVDCEASQAIYSHGSQGEYLDNGDYTRTLGEKVKSLTGQDYIEQEEFMCEYNTGYYEPMNIGDVVEYQGKKWVYVSSQSLPEEMEHQAESGELACEYRGSSYLRIFAQLD